jgi:dipeptidyl aminopeptidase/acylaminoacyl peptidase
VQELGGGSIAMRPDGLITFAEEKSCSIYLLDPASSKTTLVLEAAEGVRYADFCYHPTDLHWMLAIKEDHREATPETQAYMVHNSLVAINVNTGEEATIAEGDDFFSHPKFDPSGRRVSWIQWSHPDMPWTGTVLHLADWVEGRLSNVRKVAGKAREESIAQPKWGLDGALYFASDRTGFWQLYSFNLNDSEPRPLGLKILENAEFATAEWELGRCEPNIRSLYMLKLTPRPAPHTSHLTRRPS